MIYSTWMSVNMNVSVNTHTHWIQNCLQMEQRVMLCRCHQGTACESACGDNHTETLFHQFIIYYAVHSFKEHHVHLNMSGGCSCWTLNNVTQLKLCQSPSWDKSFFRFLAYCVTSEADWPQNILYLYSLDQSGRAWRVTGLAEPNCLCLQKDDTSGI